MRSLKNLTLLFLILVGFNSCEKYLDEKPKASLAIPTTLLDAQLLLDFHQMNSLYPTAYEVLGDNYYINEASWEAVNQSLRNQYLWEKDDEDISAWATSYTRVLVANTVLELLSTIDPEPIRVAEWKSIRGSALFFRAFYFFAIAQLYTVPYNEATLDTDMGIPLRLSSNYTIRSTRSTLRETYDQIIRDFKEAAELLPNFPLVKTRPSKLAAFGALARTYLVMHNYDSAGHYARKVLTTYDSLMDYNELSTTSNIPFPRLNKEVLFHTRSLTASTHTATRAFMDTTLLASYDPNDLRFRLYYQPNAGGATYRFKGHYDGTGITGAYVNSGIITDELYLIKAETEARAGDKDAAMQTLNSLLVTRWRTGTFVPYTASTPAEALTLVLAERRKSLVYRATRWLDIRRLWSDPVHAIKPVRVLNGITYELSKADAGLVMQIPFAVIRESGIPQNP